MIRGIAAATTKLVARGGQSAGALLALCVLGCQPDDDPCPFVDVSGFVLEIDGQRTGVECAGWTHSPYPQRLTQSAWLYRGETEWTVLDLTIGDLNPSADASYFPVTLEAPNSDSAFPWWFELVHPYNNGTIASCDDRAVGSTLRIDAISVDPEGEDRGYQHIDGFDGEFDVTLENCTFPPLNINGRDVRLTGRWYWTEK